MRLVIVSLLFGLLIGALVVLPFGWPIAYGIIQRHKGRIEARSTPGSGTTFIITLPVDSQGDSVSGTAVPSAPTP